MTMTRKQFLRTLAGVGAGAVGASVLVACSSDDSATVDAPKQIDAPPAVGNCNANGTTVAIGTNHGHVLVVSKADITAGTEKTYDITGTSAHAHSVTITAANFASLAANTSIMVTSTTGGGHTHVVTVMCA